MINSLLDGLVLRHLQSDNLMPQRLACVAVPIGHRLPSLDELDELAEQLDLACVTVWRAFGFMPRDDVVSRQL